MRLRNLVATAMAALAFSGTGIAPAQTTSPASAPARHQLVTPPGFKIINVAGRRIIAEPADEPWIRKAMETLAPATRPTTAPSDLLTKLQASRADIAKWMTATLAISDPAKVDTFLDSAIQNTEKYQNLHAPIFYLATTRGKLLAAVKAGWEDPRYYYNRAADDVMIDTGMRLSTERESDDMLLPALFLDDAPPDARSGILARTVQLAERMTTDEIARRAQVALQVQFITFSVDNVFRPLNLKPGQEWFGVGASGVLSAQYASRITGAAEDWILNQMTAESPRTPVKTATVDLLHPTDLNALRDQAVPFYLDAVRRKATAAVRIWLEKAGEPALPRVIEAIRKNPPADGDALVKLIQQETGVDLTAQVRAEK